jgi:hypothetical protein
VTRVASTLLLAALLGLLALPLAAHASPRQVLLDCEDGQLDKPFSNKDLRDALGKMSSDRDEYTDCRAVINAAIADGAGKSNGGGDSSGGGGGGGGAGTSGGSGDTGAISAEEQSARQSDAQALGAITSDEDGAPIEVGGEQVKPGESGAFDVASSENGVPTPLIALLVALGLAALGGLLFLGRKRIPSVSFPSKRPSLPRGLSRLRR